MIIELPIKSRLVHQALSLTGSPGLPFFGPWLKEMFDTAGDPYDPPQIDATLSANLDEITWAIYDKASSLKQKQLEMIWDQGLPETDAQALQFLDEIQPMAKFGVWLQLFSNSLDFGYQFEGSFSLKDILKIYPNNSKANHVFALFRNLGFQSVTYYKRSIGPSNPYFITRLAIPPKFNLEEVFDTLDVRYPVEMIQVTDEQSHVLRELVVCLNPESLFKIGMTVGIHSTYEVVKYAIINHEGTTENLGAIQGILGVDKPSEAEFGIGQSGEYLDFTYHILR